MVLSLSDFARKGGNATKEKLGIEHYSTIGKKGVASLRRKHGEDFFKKLSQAGVAARLRALALKRAGAVK